MAATRNAEETPRTSRIEALRIRDAREEDLGFIRELTATLFLAYGSYDDYLADWFRDSAVSTYVAEIEERPVGFFMLAVYPDAPVPKGAGPLVAELLAIAVAPEAQARGVGGRMMDRCLEIATDPGAGIREVRLSVAEGNSRAQRLFSKRGFRLGESVGVYPAGQRARTMRRST